MEIIAQLPRAMVLWAATLHMYVEVMVLALHWTIAIVHSNTMDLSAVLPRATTSSAMIPVMCALVMVPALAYIRVTVQTVMHWQTVLNQFVMELISMEAMQLLYVQVMDHV